MKSETASVKSTIIESEPLGEIYVFTAPSWQMKPCIHELASAGERNEKAARGEIIISVCCVFCKC